MRHASAHIPNLRRIRLRLELLEDRLPISEGIGMAMTLTALAGVNAAVADDVPQSRLAATQGARSSQEFARGRAVAGESLRGLSTPASLLVAAPPTALSTHQDSAADRVPGATTSEQLFADPNRALFDGLGSLSGSP